MKQCELIIIRINYCEKYKIKSQHMVQTLSKTSVIYIYESVNVCVRPRRNTRFTRTYAHAYVIYPKINK